MGQNMTTQDWACDRQRFVVDARDAEQAGVLPTRDHGFPLGPLGREFAALTLALLDAQNVEEVLEQVVRATARVASQADLISVTLRTPDGRFHTPVATGWTGRILDELQYEFGEGPCVTAAEDPGPGFAAWSDFSRTDSPWPRFSSAANNDGYRFRAVVFATPGTCSSKAVRGTQSICAVSGRTRSTG